MPSETAFDLAAAKHAAEVIRNPHFNAALEEITRLRETLRDQIAWIQRHLDSDVHSRQSIPYGGAPGSNSWAVVEMPEWECRQKLAALKADLAEESRPREPRVLAVGQTYLFENGWTYTITGIDKDLVSYRSRPSGLSSLRTGNTADIQRFTTFIGTTGAQLIEHCDELQTLSETK